MIRKTRTFWEKEWGYHCTWCRRRRWSYLGVGPAHLWLWDYRPQYYQKIQARGPLAFLYQQWKSSVVPD